jgi:hypothetical protein
LLTVALQLLESNPLLWMNSGTTGENQSTASGRFSNGTETQEQSSAAGLITGDTGQD